MIWIDSEKPQNLSFMSSSHLPTYQISHMLNNSAKPLQFKGDSAALGSHNCQNSKYIKPKLKN